MQNFHKHTTWSNIFTPDSTMTYKDYAKRAVELGHKTLSSLEHGWQGYYYEAFEVAKEYGLKFIFGTEAYWVKNRFENDKTNAHIVILAKNENGRRAINRILSKANIDGYYYKPRLDLKLIRELPQSDVIVTTACVAFWKYDNMEEIIINLHSYFKNNFYLEIQCHNTELQIDINTKIKELSLKYNIQMIVGLDSHFIYQNQAEERDDLLMAKGIKYEDEDGWYMDYPDDLEVFKRLKSQEIFSEEEICQAMDNTDVILTFDDIEFNKEIKLPVLPEYKNKTLEERNNIYLQLVKESWKKYKRDVLLNSVDKNYIKGITEEVKTICETNMADYFLIDHKIVERAIEKGGLITKSGRGSGVGWFTNTLLGFSNVDRFKTPIKLYPERFISKTRILESKSLPDLDLNTGNPEVFAEAQEEILGKGHSFPMIAFGTLRKKAAWKMYAKSQNISFEIANKISEQLDRYDKELLYADEDDKDTIDIADYVDKEYLGLVENSKKYLGIISDKKKAPCAYLIYDGDIESEIGLIKCKSESTKKEYITTVVDGAIAEEYKFLKNDLLKVDVVLLIDLIYKRIGIKDHHVNELLELIKGNQKVWDIYKNGITMGVNQVERKSTTKKIMRYAPTNISELTAFIAAIRPAFKSMYSRFEKREDFSYGIDVFDKIIQTEQFPYSYILYQEQTMNTLNYAGFPIEECYSIIKDISKKHPEKVLPLKTKFIEGFKQRILENDCTNEKDAIEMSKKVWQIIEDSTSYGFNSAHAVSMAIDSLYMAYLKAYYPYEFYEVMLQVYSDKGKKDKVVDFQKEMEKFYGIKMGEYKFGLDNRNFLADSNNKIIYPSLSSIKGIGQKTANALYEISQEKRCNSFYDIYKEIKNNKNNCINKGHLETLIHIGYFKEFADIYKLLKFLELCKLFYDRKSIKIENASEEYINLIEKHSTKSDKQYNKLDSESLLKGIWDMLHDKKSSTIDLIINEYRYLGNISTKDETLSGFVIITSINTTYSPKIQYYSLKKGFYNDCKISKKLYNKNKVNVGDIIKINSTKYRPQSFKDQKGEYVPIEGTKELWIEDYSIVRRFEEC